MQPLKTLIHRTFFKSSISLVTNRLFYLRCYIFKVVPKLQLKSLAKINAHIKPFLNNSIPNERNQNNTNIELKKKLS